MAQVKEKLYDLLKEGGKVREQLQKTPNPVVEARNMMSQTILSNVLLALSEGNFYQYISQNKCFNTKVAAEELDYNPIVFNALIDYLVGRSLLKKDGDEIIITKTGEIFFNAYTRGVCNVYLGGYKSILYNLAPLLLKKISLNDSILNRSAPHAATGTSQLTCVFTIPEVLRAIDAKNCRCVLDLGCGTGDFLIQLARLNPQLEGVGLDMSHGAIEMAKERAIGFSLDQRLQYFEAEVGKNDLSVPKEILDKVDIVTSMYMLHEFGRDGDEAIVKVLSSLKRQLKGKLLLLLEVDAFTPEDSLQDDADHYGRLDYMLIHVLSRQGLPKKPEQWHRVFLRADCKIIEPGIKIGGSYIYILQL